MHRPLLAGILALPLAAYGGTDADVFTGPTSTTFPLGSTTDVGTADAVFGALAGRVDAAFDEAGAFDIAALPDSGTATYNGVLGGVSVRGNSIVFYSGLRLTLDFGTDALSGIAGNFVTNEPFFASPGGNVVLSGGMSDAMGKVALDFTGSGTLATGTDAVAVTITGRGVVGGPGGAVARGTAETDFLGSPTSIFLSSFNSETEGDWYAE